MRGNMATHMTLIGLVTALLHIISWSLVTAQTCPTPECHYLATSLSPHVTCSVSGFNHLPPCYGEWSSIKSCVCDDPSYAITESGRTYWCEGGAWEPDVYALMCIGPCTIDAGENVIAMDSANNVVTDGTIPSEDIAQYSCPPGYTGSGTAQVACLNGAWEPHQQFNCFAGCNFPNNTFPTNPAVVEPTVHGAVISLECDVGYIPGGRRTSTCTNGNFVPEIICSVEQCADDQCELDEELVDEKLNYASPQRYGNIDPPNYCYGQWSYIDTFTCVGTKWVLRPVVSTIYCTDTTGVYQWTEDIHNLTCHEPCRRLSGIPADIKTLDPQGMDEVLFEHEHYVTYECDVPAKTTLGVKTTVCYDGSWASEAIPQCVSSCNFPVNSHSTRGKVAPIPHGDTVILQCDEGFEPRDTVTAHCQDGTLAPVLTCSSST